MAFSRQSVSNKSTFTIDGQGPLDTIVVPSFQRWENVTTDTRWELGQGWTLNVPNNQENINFQLNGQIVYTITKEGLTNDVLSLENYFTEEQIPSTYSSAGLLARINGELYMSTTLTTPH